MILNDLVSSTQFTERELQDWYAGKGLSQENVEKK